jgi:hypothetical protein
VWFDYEWQDWKQQITESCDLLRKIPSMSIFKITLTGKTDWLGGTGEREPLVAKEDSLSRLFPDYGPFETSDVKTASICSTLYQICRRAIADAVPDTQQRCVRPLAAYEYNDGTPVLTITFVVGELDNVQGLIRAVDLQDWQFAILDWRPPKEIAIPFLGLRERLAVDRLMPNARPRAVVKTLKLRLSKDYWESVRTIQNYMDFYRQVPQFLRVNF